MEIVFNDAIEIDLTMTMQKNWKQTLTAPPVQGSDTKPADGSAEAGSKRNE